MGRLLRIGSSSLLRQQVSAEELHLAILHVVAPAPEAEMLVGGAGLVETHHLDPVGMGDGRPEPIEELDLPVVVDPLVEA